jgi:excinuclease ABC subunit B
MAKKEKFKIVSEYKPTGDQPQAIEALVKSINAKNRYQTLLGVTGSGKTFTMANVIERVQRPTLVICHNKTLAAQLYSEFKMFFPNNAVEYFVSYYDYYQPEAYIPQTDTHIEKDASINEEIERFRIATTSSLLNRRDVIVVASVSCIYGLGSPEDFLAAVVGIEVGQKLRRDDFLEQLVHTQYSRSDKELSRTNFRVRGEVIDIAPADQEAILRVEFWGDTIDSIQEIDPDNGKIIESHQSFKIYPANPYVTPQDKIHSSVDAIRKELDERIDWFEHEGKLLEAQRLRLRTEYDIEMLQELGFCSGIENYSLYLGGRAPGSRPWCLIDFFPKDFLTIIDESHVSLPQIRGMYNGDRVRKQRLVDYGFRLPSALDNRPLRPDEFDGITGQTCFVSATPAEFEFKASSLVVEQLMRPTGLLDPIMEVYPIKGQVEHLIGEINKTIEKGDRILVTTLTKRMSEDLSHFLRQGGIRVEYLHSDIGAIERVEILRNLRAGKFDVLVGVNLLREGLDLPEVALVAILDADKEGFLRSETSLIQTAGRAARHEEGRVLLYADKMTDSLKKALAITEHRRREQLIYNERHGITPRSVKRSVQSSLYISQKENVIDPISLADAHGDQDIGRTIAGLETEMLEAADKLEFERAALIRDQIEALKLTIE